MRVPAVILLSMLITTPAMAIDIVSGSGAAVKNGAGLTVVNGDSCAGRGEAACLDRESERRDRRVPDAAVQEAGEPSQIECRTPYSPGCE